MKNPLQLALLHKYPTAAKLSDTERRDILESVSGFRSSTFITQSQFEEVMPIFEAIYWERFDLGVIPEDPKIQSRNYWQSRRPSKGMADSRMLWRLRMLWNLLSDYLPEHSRSETYLAGILAKSVNQPKTKFIGENGKLHNVTRQAALAGIEAIKDRLKHLPLQ